MTRPFCDDCEKELTDAKSAILVREIVFAETGHPPRGAQNLHFCDNRCMNSWVVKQHNRPQIIAPAQ